MNQQSNAMAYPNPRYAWYVLGVLTLVYIFSFIDRQILNLLVTPIKADLNISDTQISLLIGLTFAVFYTLFGIPLGRIADAWSRRGLITVGFALWSVFTIGCGLTGSFAQLALMRVGVGVGEASLGPSAYSMITDYFETRRRCVAQGIYNTGIYAGSGLALVLGGLAIAAFSRQPLWNLPVIGAVRWWQMVFFLMGGAGLLAVPLMFSVKEPQRREASKQVSSLRQVLEHYRRHRRTYTLHNVGLSLLALSAYADSVWMPTYFIRHHHWSSSHAGVVLGSIAAVFGALGAISAGWVSDRMAEQGQADACMRVGAWIAAAWFPFGIGCLLVANPVWAAVLLAPTYFFAAGMHGIGPPALMQVTPPRMRGQAAAVYLLGLNLIGLGIGPTAVALLTDYLFKDVNRVGYSLLMVTVAAHCVATALLWLGRGAYVRSRDAVAALAAGGSL